MKTKFINSFDNCLLGITDEWRNFPVVIYSKSKMIDEMISMGYTFDDAVEYLEYNVWGAYQGEGTPIFCNDLNGVTRKKINEILDMYGA